MTGGGKQVFASGLRNVSSYCYQIGGENDTSRSNKCACAEEVTLNVSNEIGELRRSPQRYLEPNLIETYSINLFALKQNQWARIRKPNPLHFVFLI